MVLEEKGPVKVPSAYPLSSAREGEVMKVKKLMITEVGSCPSGDHLDKAAQVMWELDCGCVPIIDPDSKVVGMLTDRDICMATYTQGRALEDISVSSVMSKEVYSCSPEDDLTVAENIMENKQVRRLPVIDNEGRLVGLLSLNDIARRAAHEEGKKRVVKGLKPTEVAHTLAGICQPHRAATPTQGL
jgi:CBS domain-containing protein